MLSRLRKTGHFFVFSPINDLSQLGQAGAVSNDSETAKARAIDVKRNGAEIVGDEWSKQIVQNRVGITLRSGMILKNDQWLASSMSGSLASDQVSIKGAINFRRVPQSSLYALGQPNQAGIESVLDQVLESSEKVVWINLR